MVSSTTCPVVNWGGPPVAGVQITAMGSSGNIIGQPVTDEAGKYVFENLPRNFRDNSSIAEATSSAETSSLLHSNAAGTSISKDS